MKPLSVSNARLIERRSDEQDHFGVTNEMRDLLNQEGRFFREATTTDDTPTVIWSMPIKQDTLLRIEIAVLSYRAATGDAGQSTRLQYHKNVAGVGADGNVEVTYDDYDAAGSISLARNGTTLELTVTGAASQTIAWHARLLAIECPWVRT